MNPTPDHSSRAHSRISPSGLGLLAVCPSFANDNSKPEHPLTTEGTLIHQHLETRDLSGLREDLRPIAQVGINFWDKLRAENPDWKEQVEPCIQITDEMKGHLDLIRVGETEAAQIDYKSGRFHQATAATNIQQKAYAVGLFKLLPHIQKITVYLVYLRLEEVDYEVFTREQLPQLELEVLAVLRRAQAAQRGEIDERRPDPAACTWCKHAGTCPALHQLALPVAQAYASARPEDLTIPDAYDPALIESPDVMAKAKVVAGIMKKWCESVDYWALQMRLNQGVEIPGTTLATRAGTKKINDPNEALRIAQEHGITFEEFLTTVDVSASQLLDIAHSKAARGKKGQAKEALEDALLDSGALSVGADTMYLRKSK